MKRMTTGVALALSALMACTMTSQARADIEHHVYGEALNWFADIEELVFHEETGFVGLFTMDSHMSVAVTDITQSQALGVPAGAKIGPDLGAGPVWSSTLDPISMTDGYVTFPLCASCPWNIFGEELFLPVRREVGQGQHQYGWLRIVATCSYGPPKPECANASWRTLYFVDGVFETTINKPIVAGDSGCLADCDANGELSIDDFICFQTLFALGEPSADCDADGSLSIDDFICFQTTFAIGC